MKHHFTLCLAFRITKGKTLVDVIRATVPYQDYYLPQIGWRLRLPGSNEANLVVREIEYGMYSTSGLTVHADGSVPEAKRTELLKLLTSYNWTHQCELQNS